LEKQTKTPYKGIIKKKKGSQRQTGDLAQKKPFEKIEKKKESKGKK